MLLFDWARFHIRRKNMPWQRRKKPKKTRKRYEQILFRFIRFCERRGVKRLEDLDQDIYARFIQHLKEEKKLSPATINTYKSVLKQVFRHFGIPISVKVRRCDNGKVA